MGQDRHAAFRCPHCGGQLNVSPMGEAWSRADFDTRTFGALHSGDGAAAEAWREAIRTTPHSKATRESEVIVPLEQAAITAGVITLPVAVVTALAGWPVYVPVIVGAVSFTASWFWLLRDSRGLLRVTERLISRDLNGDGMVGDQPMPSKPSSVRVEVTERRDGGTTMRFLDMPIDEAQLQAFAKGILAGKSFSERTWAGDGKPFSQNDFAALRDKLIETGYARWRGGERRMGAELTAKGRAMFAGLANSPTPPPRQ
ncbi:MAG TPA: hypothetical protein VJ793_00555 [Anaerolineae bacterium]|nr:hypothetical protein [Anaerolineae bacterium]